MFEMVMNKGWRFVHFVSSRGFALAAAASGIARGVLMMISTPEVMMMQKMSVDQTLRKSSTLVEDRSHSLEELE